MDIVFTYVNQKDVNWQKNKIFTYNSYFDSAINNKDSNSNTRFNDNNEIMYSLRSIEKFINFVKNIYIVVSDIEQIPDWINTEKIKFVTHSEIIPKEFLPTFNSHVIELYIHNIPNLSEKFIYFNDDMIIGTNIEINDFVKEDKLIFYLSPDLSKEGTPNSNEIGYRSAWKNSNNWLNSKYKNEQRKKLYHAPIVVSKIVYRKLINLMEKEVLITSKSKFRSITDYNIICSVYPYYCYYNEIGLFLNDECISIFEDDLLNLDNKYNKIKHNNIKFFCVNEYFDSNVFLLDYMFPLKSSYEI